MFCAVMMLVLLLRPVSGIALLTDLYQVFLNIVLDDAVEEKEGGEKVRIGMVVCSYRTMDKGLLPDRLMRLFRSFEEIPLSCSRHWRG